MRSTSEEMFQAVIVEMIRDGILPVEIMDRLQTRFEGEVEHHAGLPDRQERYANLAQMAAGIALEAKGADAADFRADQRRRQMRAKTAWLAAQSTAVTPDKPQP